MHRREMVGLRYVEGRIWGGVERVLTDRRFRLLTDVNGVDLSLVIRVGVRAAVRCACRAIFSHLNILFQPYC